MAIGVTALAAGSAVAQGAGGNVLSRVLEVSGNYLMPFSHAPVNEVIELFLLGYASNQQFVEQAMYNGLDFSAEIERNNFVQTVIGPSGVRTVNESFMSQSLTVLDKTLINHLYKPTIDEATSMLRRGLIDDRLYHRFVRMQVGTERDLIDVFKDFRYEIPGPSDLIRMAVREAFSNQIVASYQHNKELPSSILPWMAKQGYDQPLGIERPPGSTNDRGQPIAGQATWSDLYWWSHWELPSIGQGYEMLHRLYPQSDFGPSPDYQDGLGFTSQDMSTLLKTQDISPYWRARLEAMSYSPLTRVDVRRMYDIGVLGENEVYHAYRAIGYNDTNAKNLLNFTKQLRSNKEAKSGTAITKSWVCKYYKLGVIDKDKGTDLLQQIGLPLQAIDTFFKVCDTELLSVEIGENVKDLKQGFFTGQIDNNELRSLMERIGMKGPKIDSLIATWNRRKTLVRKTLSAKENLSLFSDGILNENDLIVRLQNLGYNQTYISSMLQQARLRMLNERVQRELKEQAQRQKELDKAKREQLKAAREQAKELASIEREKIKKILAAATDKNLVSWYEKGLIDIADVAARLQAKDFLEVDVSRWIKDKLGIDFPGGSNEPQEETSPSE